MQTTATWTALAFVASLFAGSVAHAQKKPRKFDVEFERVANSCKDTGMSMKKATVELTPGKKKKSLSVSIPMVPVMKGRTKRNGKFNANAKRGKTGIAGVDGKFSVAGTIDGDTIELVFIAEYFQGKAPLCTQSWKGSGKKQ